MRFIAAAGVVLSTHALGADERARTALDQAFDRQHALPGYVEHQFGRMPMQSSPQAAASGLDRPGDPDDKASAAPMGPERELLTTQHAGDRQRQLLQGVGEIVRANGRVAHRFNLSPQVAQLRAAATTTPAEGLEIVAGVMGSLKDTYDYLSQGPIGGLLAAMTVFDQTSQMLSRGAGQESLFRAADMLEQQTAWHCEPDDPGSHHSGKVIDVQQLADESIGGVPANVYSQTRLFEFNGPPGTSAGTPLRGFRVQSRAWVRIADGLPLRSELVLPGRGPMRTEYEYPVVPVEFPVPECVTRP